MPPSDAPQDVPDLVPARMLNEFAYCPRLAWLEWVQGDFADSADTVDGRHQHRRVDREAGELPVATELAGADERLHARSVYLSGPKVGLVARIDLVEATGSDVTPVDYKRGEPPDVPEGAWEPERVQLCAQGLVLEENGYSCREGVLYFAASRRRVTIPFTPELRARTVELLVSMREALSLRTIPPPLEDSPKCPRCSLVGICLPDEVNHLRLPDRADEDAGKPRRLVAARDDALQRSDFVARGGAVALREAARARVLRAYERRMDELVTHPVFGYRVSYRRVLEVQVRLLGRFLGGEIPEYPAFQTR